MECGWPQDIPHGPQGGLQYYWYSYQEIWEGGTTHCYTGQSTLVPGNENIFSTTGNVFIWIDYYVKNVLEELRGDIE